MRTEQRSKYVSLMLSIVDLLSFQRREWASAIVTIIEHYADISIAQELSGAQVHRAENSFTLSVALHGLFNSFYVALSPVPDPDSPVRGSVF